MSTGAFITCRELIDFIGDYFEHSLTAAQQLDFDRHLARCASCRAYLQSYRTTLHLVKSSEDALDDAPEELIKAILEVRQRGN